MATFTEVAAKARIGGRFGNPAVAELAEALEVFEQNTARMLAAFNVATLASHPLHEYQQQVHERTHFILEELRRPLP